LVAGSSPLVIGSSLAQLGRQRPEVGSRNATFDKLGRDKAGKKAVDCWFRIDMAGKD
jgi:hypothetical protein